MTSTTQLTRNESKIHDVMFPAAFTRFFSFPGVFDISQIYREAAITRKSNHDVAALCHLI